jgi:hypothetical protein
VNTIRRWPYFARWQVKFAEHLRPSLRISLASHVIASTLDGTSLPSACYVFGRWALRIAPPRKPSSGKPRLVQRGFRFLAHGSRSVRPTGDMLVGK